MTTYKQYNFKTKYLRNILITSVFYFVLGIAALLYSSDKYFFSIAFIFMGLLFSLRYFIWKKYGYIRITDEGITSYFLWPKTISFQKLKGIRYHVGEFKILSTNKELSINKDIIKEEELIMLEADLKQLISVNI